MDKLECADLEGVGDLPEDIRPTPSQKPHKVSKISEPSEENRLLYIDLMRSLVCREDRIEDYVEPSEYRLFINDIVNITRTLVMDPCTDVVLSACKFLQNICQLFNKELLFCFTSILSRAVFYPLTSRQSKLRLVALDCLNALMQCSPYKQNVEVMEGLIGFRDPNLVPIKDFYEPSTKLNYLAFLVSDSSSAVLEKFFHIITDWLIKLEDRYDHEARLMPYVLSGLFNKEEHICQYVADRLEQVGMQYEVDNEAELRETKQFGIDGQWTIYCTEKIEDNGTVQIKFADLYYPFPLARRPRLGSRVLVKKYIRRYMQGLCKEYESIEESIKIKVSNLLLFSIAYAEEGIIEYLDGIIICFGKEIAYALNKTNNKNSEIVESIYKSLRLLGRFCDYEAITKIIFPTILGEMNSNYPELQRASVIMLKFIIKGHLETLHYYPKPFGMFDGKLKEIIKVLTEKSFTSYIDSSTALILIDFWLDFLNLSKQRDYYEVLPLLDQIFESLIESLGALAIFDLHGASNIAMMQQIEKKFDSISEVINFMLKERKYFSSEKIQLNSQDIKEVISNSSDNKNFLVLKIIEKLNSIKLYLESNNLTINNKMFKIFYIFLKRLNIFTIDNNLSKDIISLILELFYGIFNSSQNILLHQESMKILVSFLSGAHIDIVNKNSLLMIEKEISILFPSIMNDYNNIEIEKFKFVDLLKDEKELEKKKLKSPKTIKSETREKCLILIKTVLNKNPLLNLTNISDQIESMKLINILLTFFNDSSILSFFVHEKEPLRRLFIETYHQVLVKFMTIGGYKIDTNNLERRVLEYKNLKVLINNFEDYFLNQIYDSVMEVRQMCLSILNIIMCLFIRSEFYEPMGKMFKAFRDERDVNKYNFESLKVLAYLEEENLRISSIFCNFKDIFLIVINLYIDEKFHFGPACEIAMKNFIEKFPIFFFDEFTKARNKSQMKRVEIMEKMITKYLN